MAKIRTLDQLEAALTADLSWRRHELWVFESTAQSANDVKKSALMRAGLALLYAHWEGYVKSAGSMYLEYVSRKGLKLGELAPELAAIAMRAEIQRLAVEKYSESHTQLVKTIWDSTNDAANLPYGATTIRTYANLNYRLFESIMHSLGCDSQDHRTKSLLIDERLLSWRNEIAHGRGQQVDLADWRDLRDAVEGILVDVRIQLSNAAALQSYRRAAGEA